MAESPKVQFRVSESMTREIQSRVQAHGGQIPEEQRGTLFSMTAQRDLHRYYSAIPQTLYTINLSYGEAMVLVDALNGYLVTPELPQLMVHNVRDAIAMDGLDKKWKIDGRLLIHLLEQLTPLECLALTDAVERWWNNSTYHISEERESYEMRCMRVGLIRVPRKSTLLPQVVESTDEEAGE